MKARLLLIGVTLLAAVGIFISSCVKDDVYVGPPTISNVSINPQAPGATDSVIVTATVNDLKGINSATLYYKASTEESFTTLTMDAGVNYTYSAKIPTFPISTVVTYYIEAKNVSNLTAVYPSNAPTSTSAYTVGAPAIVINEIFSRGVAADPDWIELYNSSDNAVDISGYKIYDSGGQSGSKAKMTIPASTTIASKGYYVIVVDDAASANPSGSNFGLSSAGEEVWLESSAGYVIDDVIFPDMTASSTISYGRKPDGSSTWEILTTVTKNGPNSATAATITGLAINPTAPKATDAVVVTATVTDAQGLSTVKLYYKVGSGTYTFVTMTHVGDDYSGTIPAQAAASVVSYYIEATNTQSIISYSPNTAPTTAATYTVASAPSISGLGISPSTPGASDAVVVSATITDANTLSSVKLYYKVDAGSFTSVTMSNVGNVYSGSIPAQVAASVVSYYVEATNSLSLTSYAPATAPTTPSTYTVSSLSSITGMNITPAVPTPSDVVTVNATITDIQGVTTAELYYKVGSGSYNTVTMSHSGDIYSGDIPQQSANDVVSYYIKVTNASSLITYAPADALTTPATYTVAGTPVISNMLKSPSTPTFSDQVTVSADVTGLIPTGTVKLYYKIGSGSYISIDMTHGSGDSYSAVIPAQSAPSVVSYYIEAQNSVSLVAVLPITAPATPDTYSILGPLVLNEICGLNSPDDDFIELYNSSGTDMNLEGVKVVKTDETGAVSTIFTFPAGSTITAGTYLVIAKNTNPSTYGMLSGGISNTKNVKIEIKTAADVLYSYFEKTSANLTGGHASGGSYARVPDATGDWTIVTACTRGTANPSSK